MKCESDRRLEARLDDTRFRFTAVKKGVGKFSVAGLSSHRPSTVTQDSTCC